MANTGWIKSAIATGSLSGLVAFVWSHAFLPWIVPLGTPIVIGVLAKAQGFPWTETIVFALVGFAAVTHGLLRFDEWRERRRVEGKLTFGSVLVGRDINGPGIIVGVSMVSSAAFPIEFEVAEIRTRLADKVPRIGHSRQRHTISARGYGWHYDHPIVVDPPRPGTLEGFVEFRVSYGALGTLLRYSLLGKKQVIAAFNDQGLLTNGAWNDASN